MTRKTEINLFKLLSSVMVFLMIGMCACNKIEPNPITNKDIVGKYEWSRSYDYTGKLIESSKIPEKFGILVEENGFIYTYKNGENISQYFFSDFFSQWGKIGVRNYSKLRKKNRIEEQFVFYYYEDELYSTEFPFKNGQNYLYKVD